MIISLMIAAWSYSGRCSVSVTVVSVFAIEFFFGVGDAKSRRDRRESALFQSLESLTANYMGLQ